MLTGSRSPSVLIGNWRELSSLFRNNYLDFQFVWIYPIADLAVQDFESTMKFMDKHIHAALESKDVIVTQQCIQALLEIKDHDPRVTVGDDIVAWLKRHYTLQPVVRRGLRGNRLLPLD